jgi:hypothetical protein
VIPATRLRARLAIPYVVKRLYEVSISFIAASFPRNRPDESTHLHPAQYSSRGISLVASDTACRAGLSSLVCAMSPARGAILALRGQIWVLSPCCRSGRGRGWDMRQYEQFREGNGWRKGERGRNAHLNAVIGKINTSSTSLAFPPSCRPVRAFHLSPHFSASQLFAASVTAAGPVSTTGSILASSLEAFFRFPPWCSDICCRCSVR